MFDAIHGLVIQHHLSLQDGNDAYVPETWKEMKQNYSRFYKIDNWKLYII